MSFLVNLSAGLASIYFAQRILSNGGNEAVSTPDLSHTIPDAPTEQGVIENFERIKTLVEEEIGARLTREEFIALLDRYGIHLPEELK